MGRIAELLKDNIVNKYSVIPRNVYFVDPVDGTAGGSGSELQPFNTVVEAFNNCVSGKNDCVIWIGKDNSSKWESSVAIDWNKNATHLFGACVDTLEGKRCRITQLASVTGISSLFKVSGENCIFANIRVDQGVNDATSLVAVEITGQRNKFINVEFAGIGHTTQNVASAASLLLNGTAENLFIDCVIGLDTVARNANPSEILIKNVATRNTFRNCIIKSYISAAGFPSVKLIDGTSIDRTLIFDNCMFMTDSLNQGVAQTSVFSIPVITQGKIMLKNTSAITDGTAAWDSNSRGIIWNNAPAAAATAGGNLMTKK